MQVLDISLVERKVACRQYFPGMSYYSYLPSPISRCGKNLVVCALAIGSLLWHTHATLMQLSKLAECISSFSVSEPKLLAYSFLEFNATPFTASPSFVKFHVFLLDHSCSTRCCIPLLKYLTSLRPRWCEHGTALLSIMADASDPAKLAGVPAAKPPAGVLPNLENPHGDGQVLIIVGSILLAIMLLFVSVRIYTKFRIVRKSSPDDCKFDFNPFNLILIHTDTCVIATVSPVQSTTINEN